MTTRLSGGTANFAFLWLRPWRDTGTVLSSLLNTWYAQNICAAPPKSTKNYKTCHCLALYNILKLRVWAPCRQGSSSDKIIRFLTDATGGGRGSSRDGCIENSKLRLQFTHMTRLGDCIVSLSPVHGLGTVYRATSRRSDI